jgi:protease IV
MLRARIALAALLMCAACEGRPQGEAAKSGDSQPKKLTGPAVSVVDLTGGAPEVEKSSLFGSAGPKKSFDQLLVSLDGVMKDKDSMSVLVKFGSASIGAARSQEIGEVLEKLKAKKKVICHADGYSNATMMAAARGCSQIWVSPAGGVETIGIAVQIVYMRRLLADELHFNIDFLQVGKFKGAEEPLTRDGPSPEARASLMSTLADLRTAWIESMAMRRPNMADLVEDGPYSATRAKEIGLIDEVGYPDDALASAKKDTSPKAEREQIVYGPGAEEQGGDLDDVLRALAGESSATGPVALVRATGSISMTSGGNGILGGRGGIVEKEFDRTIRRLEKDDDVKAVVLRIDSPGGSALASDLMWHHLMKLRKKKPLIVSIGDMAASGGMYLACTGDYIFAEPMSIVGSIGVVGGKIGVGDALEKIGVHAETFAANDKKPGAASRAAYESLLTRWDDPTRARVLESMTSIYDLFLARVSEGRSARGRTITKERISESAEGRIFGGREGKARGLVDEIGGLGAALAKARELAKLPEDAHVAVIGERPTFLDALEPGGAAEERAEARVQERFNALASPFAILDRAAPEIVPFVSSVAPLAEGERAVVAVPFAIVVK